METRTTLYEALVQSCHKVETSECEWVGNTNCRSPCAAAAKRERERERETAAVLELNSNPTSQKTKQNKSMHASCKETLTLHIHLSVSLWKSHVSSTHGAPNSPFPLLSPFDGCLSPAKYRRRDSSQPPRPHALSLSLPPILWLWSRQPFFFCFGVSRFLHASS